VAWALGYFASTFEGKWRRRFNDERRFYAQYRDETDRLNIEKTQRIAELETQKNVLSQEIVRLRNDLTTLTERAATPVITPAPTPEPVGDNAPMPANLLSDHAPEPEPESPVSAEPAPAPEPLIHEPEAAAEPAPVALAIGAAIAAPLAATATSATENLPHVETHDASEAPHEAAADMAAHGTEAAKGEPAPTPEEQHHEPVAIDAQTAELTRINGIDPMLAAGLASLGVRKIEDIEKLSAEDEKSIEIHLNMNPGQIANDQWRLQAALIGSGEDGDAEPEMATAEHA
ncbi:MAG: hypothetical protein K2X59_03615, partial [Sphingomonas sp.]|nr:hypothetical protein [Sphingomonas sp.]